MPGPAMDIEIWWILEFTEVEIMKFNSVCTTRVSVMVLLVLLESVLWYCWYY